MPARLLGLRAISGHQRNDSESRPFIQPEHDVHGLYGLPGRPLDQIVDNGQYHYHILAPGLMQRDPAGVGA